MKPVIFYIENKEIQFEVNLMGIETLKINGHQVSKKWSWPGRKHQFVLDAHGKIEPFYITTKQAFSSGVITVQLFHNDIFIDEGLIEFDFFAKNGIKGKSDNGMLSTGLLFVVLGLVFDWSKVFLFIGLIFLFCSFSDNSGKKQSDESSSSVDDHN